VTPRAWLCRAGAAAWGLGACLGGPAAAQTATTVRALPDTVSPPKGLNLGSTSFFDGFGATTQGWTLLQYGRYEDLTHINDANGHPLAAFKSPHIQVFTSLTQIGYTSDLHPFGGDAVGFSAALPLDDVTTHFAANSPATLHSSGPGAGNLVWGPIYQSRVYFDGDQPVYSWRVQLIVESPAFSFNKHYAVNPGIGYWAVNPYYAFTYLPRPQLEFSSRLNYQYNLPTGNFQNPQPTPGVTYHSGQAGQLVYGNVDASYEVAPDVHLGVNGYFLDELTPDKTNGQRVGHTIVSEIAAGPGGRYVFDPSNALNLNLYLPMMCNNCTGGVQFNAQFIHHF